MVIESNEAVLDSLIESGFGKEAERGLNVSVEGQAVGNREDPVEETADLWGTGGQLFNLNAILTGDVLVGQLNDEVVNVLDENLELGAYGVEVEIVDDIEALSDNSVNELVGLINLIVASRFFVCRVSLGAKGVTKEGLPWLVVNEGLGHTIWKHSVGRASADFLVDVIKGGSLSAESDCGNSH